MTDDKISLITYLPQESQTNATGKGPLAEAIAGQQLSSSLGDQSKGIGRVEVSAAAIERQMTQLLTNVGGILNRARQNAGEMAGMELQEVEISVAINAAGEVSLLGIGGAQAGVQGAITLKFGQPD